MIRRDNTLVRTEILPAEISVQTQNKTKNSEKCFIKKRAVINATDNLETRTLGRCSSFHCSCWHCLFNCLFIFMLIRICKGDTLEGNPCFSFLLLIAIKLRISLSFLSASFPSSHTTKALFVVLGYLAQVSATFC